MAIFYGDGLALEGGVKFGHAGKVLGIIEVVDQQTVQLVVGEGEIQAKGILLTLGGQLALP